MRAGLLLGPTQARREGAGARSQRVASPAGSSEAPGLLGGGGSSGAGRGAVSQAEPQCRAPPSPQDQAAPRQIGRLRLYARSRMLDPGRGVRAALSAPSAWVHPPASWDSQVCSRGQYFLGRNCWGLPPRWTSCSLQEGRVLPGQQPGEVQKGWPSVGLGLDPTPPPLATTSPAPSLRGLLSSFCRSAGSLPGVYKHQTGLAEPLG